MANEFIITDLVDKKAVQQLKELRLEFDSTKESYVELAKELAQGVKTNPKTFDELSQKARNYTSLLEKLNKTQENMASIQAKQLTVLRQVSQQLNSMSSLQKLNLLFEQFAKNIKNASDMLAGLSSASNQMSSAQDNAAKSTQTASNIISQASTQLQAANMNYAAIIDTVQAYDGEVTKLTADTIANKEAMKKINADIKSLAKSYKDGEITLSEYIRQSSLLKQRHTELMAQNQQYSALIKNHSTAIISASGSYYEMNAAMLELQKRYKALSEADRESSVGKNLIAQANALNNKLKEIDSQFGNYQRNVGNYASSWNGLQMQVQQIARELPNAALGLNMFIIAISNNLPMLIDEIKRTSDEVQRLRMEGQKTVSVWKQLMGAVFSWQTAVVVGITILTAYRNEISDWVASLFRGKKALDEIISVQDKLRTAQKGAIRDTIEERIKLELLYKAATDNKKAMEERIVAANELKNTFPKLFDNYTKEQIMTGNAKDAYRLLTAQIIATAKAKRVMNEVTKAATNYEETEFKRLNQVYTVEKARAEYQKFVDTGLSRTEAGIDAKKKLEAEEATLKALKEQSIQYKNQMNDLEKLVDVKALVNDPGKNNKAYDDEKKKVEEYAEYIKKITEDLSKSKIELIADGREREIAEISKEYYDRIKEIKGRTDEEIELRKNLETLKGKAIAEINDKYDKELLEIEKTNLENRLASIGENSNEELDKRLNLQIQLNNMMRDAEIKDAEKNGEDVVAIRMKYMQRENSLIMRNLQERIGLIEANTDKVVNEQETSALKEANIIKKQYANGEISKEDYEKKLYDIGVKYAKARLETLMKEAEAEMSLLDPNSEKYQELEDRLANLQAQINGINYDDATKKREEWIGKFKEGLSGMNSAARDALGETAGIFEGLSDIMVDVAEDGKLSFENMAQAVGKIVSGITSLMTDIYDAQIENIEKEQEANDEAYDKEIERIEALEENGAISTEEAEVRKRAAEDKTAAKNAELEKKKAALQEKQAKWNKANSIIQAGIFTALAITEALPNLVLAALVGAMGAAQVALIAAQPIPKYAKGTKDHPGGLAIVGDGGKKEGIVTNNGLFITPDKPTLVDLPAHAQVIPDLSYIYDRSGLTSDYGLLEQKLKNMREEGIVVNVNNDYSRLERKMESNTKQLQNIGRIMKKANHIADYNWISSRV